MKKQIIAFLKTQLPGVQDSYINGVAEFYSKTIIEEKDIETVLTKNTIEALKYSSEELQKEGDRRATTAVKTYQDKHGLTEDGKPVKVVEPPKPGAEEVPAWVKDLQTRIQSLDEKFKNTEKEKTFTSLSGKVTEALKAKGIPNEYSKGRITAIETEEQIDQLVGTIETDYQGFMQYQAEQGVIIQRPPMGSGSGADSIDMSGYLKEKFPEKK